MIREGKFLISKRPYALDLDSLKTSDHANQAGNPFYGVSVGAVWFRRRRGITVACIGYLWDYLDAKPASAREAAERMDDGRYGGSCVGRWDGELYWGAQRPDEMEHHLAILRPMLEDYPAAPSGYDGWWRFE